MVEGINNVRVIRRVSRLPRSEQIFVRRQDAAITRERQRPPIEIGEDILEQRAIPKGTFPGATLPERIVYKKLDQLVGHDKVSFQRDEFGGRNILGGFVIDFLVYITNPPICIEVLGAYWHQSATEYRDLERALVIQQLGYEYHELHEMDIYQSDERLEQLLEPILGNRHVTRGAFENGI